MDAATQPFEPRTEAERRLWDAGWRPQGGAAFVELIGPVWEREDGELGRFAFIAEDKHRNVRDVIHGGMLMAFVDRAMGLTSRRSNDNQPQATVQLDCQFLDAVQVGDVVEATCTVVRRTRFLMFMSCVVRVGEKDVFRANGIWKVLGPKPAARPAP